MQRASQQGRLDSVRKNGDAQLENVAGKRDIALLIVGPTGAGKSTFIRNILQSVNSNLTSKVQDDLRRFTERITQYEVQLPNDDRRVIVVDTPSFDRGSGENALEVLRQISSWLASLYVAGYQVSGIVFLYPIYPGRLSRIDVASFRVFRKLCGSRHFLRIIGITTKWDSFTASEEVGQSRERDIWTGFWKDVESNRSEPVATNRLCNSIERARNVLDFILQQCNTNLPSSPLTIQKQIVDQGKAFLDTSAAKLLTSLLINKFDDPGRYSLNRLILRFRQSTESIILMTESHTRVEVLRDPSESEVIPSIHVEQVEEEAGESTNIKAAHGDLQSPSSSQRHCDSCTCYLHSNGEEAEAAWAQRANQEPPPSVRFSIASNDTVYYSAPSSPEAEINTIPWPAVHPGDPLSSEFLRPASVYLDVSMSASFSSSSSTLLPAHIPSFPLDDRCSLANSREPPSRAPPIRMNDEQNISISASFSSSSSTLLPTTHSASPPGDTSSLATLQGPPPRINNGNPGVNARSHLGLLNDASQFVTGDIRAHQIQGSSVRVSGSNNTVNIYCSDFCQRARHRQSRPHAS